MTMSGDRSEPSVPLDLRIRDRERGSGGGQSETDSSPIVSPALGAQVGVKSSPAEQKPPASKLPLRKRPFLHKNDAGLRAGAELCVDPRGSPTPAKVPRSSNAHNGQSAEPRTQRSAPSPSTGHSRGQQQTHGATRYHYAYFSPYGSVPFHVCEDTNHLLQEVAMATHQDEDGDTALHIAVAQEKEAVVKRLINILYRARKDLDLYNNLRQTPLHLAVITRQPALVGALLQGGADPGALDRNGQNTLHLCCEHNEESCLSVILSHLTHTPCCPSAFLDSRNYAGLTPLHLAVQDGNLKLAKMLLDSGADINAVDIKSGRSPLVHAVENNCLEMVNFLIENGCNVNAQSYSGNTALHSACGRGEVEAVRVLLKNGADSSLKNYHNDTAVMVAKNKKVSDVLRGKTTRGHTLKTQHSFNGAPSPNNMTHSPLANPNLLPSISLSPAAAHNHSPQSQSCESRSGNQSPTETQEEDELQRRARTFHETTDNRVEYGLSIPSYSFFPTHRYDTLMPPVLSSFPAYYSTAFQRHPYPTDTEFILLPAGLGRTDPLSQGLHPNSIATQSRPSSHNSEQSDNSNMSSEEKGIS
ncbi:B-cell lymphoma 3 protein [Hoplias malabaricus]|uniref:B-cell lymphoma 3 protein n=1 Tax=Hoplias malabaricus TaxID=27720 RepID=UPI0034632578